MEVRFINKRDSIAAEVKITNERDDIIYFPGTYGSTKPQHEISFAASTLEMRVGISSSRGISFEIPRELQSLNPHSTLSFRTIFIKKGLLVKSVVSFDFIDDKDWQLILDRNINIPGPLAKWEGYISLVHVIRVETFIRKIHYKRE